MYLETLQKIYELILSEKELTKENLNSVGITDEQITSLVEDGIIYLNKKGTYNITSINKLFLYGKKNLIQGNKRTAITCFELCYKLKPKHRETCLQLFYNAILHQDYQKAYEYLYALEHVSTQEYMRKDYSIYLYLLSQVSEVPETYKEKIESINNDRNLITHKKPNKQQRQDNKVIDLVQKGKYKFAIESLNDFLASDYDYEVHRIIIKTLISHIITQDEKYKKDLLDKVKHKRYREIISILESISLTRTLRTDEQSILEITQAIISIFETNELPTPIANEATTVLEAIKYYDYQKAMDIETAFLTSKNIPADSSSINFLLNEIIKLIGNVNRLKDNDMIISPKHNS